MAITPITPSNETNTVYAWLQTDKAVDLIKSGATFATIVAMFCADFGLVVSTEQRQLNAAVASNTTSNIILGLEKCVALSEEGLTAMNDDLTLTVGTEGGVVLSNANGAEFRYEILDTTVAHVAPDGQVTGISPGTTTYTAHTIATPEFHSQSVTIPVIVNAA